MHLYEYTAFQLACSLEEHRELDQAALRPLDGYTMPCEPREIRFYRCLPVHHSRFAKLGYLMGHLLSFSQRAGRWVGVTMDYFYQDGKNFLEALPNAQECLQHLQQIRMCVYRRNCRLTLGLYSWWVTPPNPPEPLPQPEATTLWRLFGEPTKNYLGLGLSQLGARNFVRLASEGEDNHRVEIIYPTPELVAYVIFTQPAS